MIGFSDQLS